MDNTTVDIVNEIRTFITSHFLLNAFECPLDEHTSFMESGIIDSTGILELISFLQEKYAITIEEGEMNPSNLDTLSRVSAYISRKLGI
ncbi:MAG TPA: acyl carrier protein [Chitinispirillaceae bacterium]|nr:acyl carrier protein [Chitinispirillaceae bacterium]